MSIRTFLSKLKGKKSTTLTDEDRKAAIEYRRMQTELRQRERMLAHQNRLLELKTEQMDFIKTLNEVKGTKDKDEADNMLMNLLQMVMMRQQAMPPASTQAPPPTIQPMPGTEQADFADDMNEEQIRPIIEQIPKSVRKKLTNLPDESLAGLVLQHMPHASENTIISAIEILRQSV